MSGCRRRSSHAVEGAANSVGLMLVDVAVVVIIIGILAAVAVPICVAQTRRPKTTEANSTLGAVRTAEEVYKAEKGDYLAVAAGNVSTDSKAATPGLGLDFSRNTYFSANCLSVATDPMFGFVATCDGAAGNTAPRKADVGKYVIQLRGNGQCRYSYDGGKMYSSWE